MHALLEHRNDMGQWLVPAGGDCEFESAEKCVWQIFGQCLNRDVSIGCAVPRTVGVR